MSLPDRIQNVKDRVNKASSAMNLDPSHITIIGVTKGVEASVIKESLKLGICDIGENKVQEISSKYSLIGGECRWHMIGYLQTNKIKQIIGKVHLIHSVDRIKLAEEINLAAEKNGIVQDILLQVNISGENTKHGLNKDAVSCFVENVSKMKSIKVKGLMTIPPNFENPEYSRTCFSELRDIYYDLKKQEYPNIELKYLSMGMSNDYEYAILEGSNMIRVGRAIYSN